MNLVSLCVCDFLGNTMAEVKSGQRSCDRSICSCIFFVVVSAMDFDFFSFECGQFSFVLSTNGSGLSFGSVITERNKLVVDMLVR